MASGIEEVRPHHQLIRTPFQRQIGKDFFQDGIGFRCPKQDPVGILKSIILKIEIEHLESLTPELCAPLFSEPPHLSSSPPIRIAAPGLAAGLDDHKPIHEGVIDGALQARFLTPLPCRHGMILDPLPLPSFFNEVGFP